MVKRIFVILFCPAASLVFVAAAFAQVPTPGAADLYLDDRNIKTRSIELERVKRDAEKGDQKSSLPADPATFGAIKQDFERIQRLQNTIITVYTRSKVIDYGTISKNGSAMVAAGSRLKKNLFPEPDGKASRAITNENTNEPRSPIPSDVRGLIVELDRALAAFIRNPIFTDPKVVNVTDNKNAEAQLDRLIMLGSGLRDAAGALAGK